MSSSFLLISRIINNNIIVKNKRKYSENAFNIFPKAAITTASRVTAHFGRTIFEKGGSVADCAIAVLLCSGIRNPERMGIGGGFILTYYDNKTKKVHVLLARDRAPLASTPDMFEKIPKVRKESLPSVFGGLAVAVPGALKGYWELHQKYGRLPWKFLIEPAIQLCKDGVLVEAFTRYGLEKVESDILHSDSLRQILTDPFTGRIKGQQEKIYRHTLGKTLELVAEKGPDALYDGELTNSFVEDIKNEGGIITPQDLAMYRPIWLAPLKLPINELIIHTPPPPSSGVILLLIINILKNRGAKFLNARYVDHWFQIVEAWKHAYAYRCRLGDPKFVLNIPELVDEILSDETAIKISSKIKPYTSNDISYYGSDLDVSNDEGTSHFNFVSPDGDAISVTETINALFGALFRSVSTGIILNNAMADFSIPDEANIYRLPPFPANLIFPGKTPLSSMVPTIITDKEGELRLLTGGAGGPRIITAVSLVLVQHLLRGICIDEAVDMVRLHHQLLPMELMYETDFPLDELHVLKIRGHEAHPIKYKSVVSVILKNPQNQLLYAKGDLRRHCANDGF